MSIVFPLLFENYEYEIETNRRQQLRVEDGLADPTVAERVLGWLLCSHLEESRNQDSVRSPGPCKAYKMLLFSPSFSFACFCVAVVRLH